MRIWAVEHDEAQMLFRRGSHGERHRPDVGVIARADVLQVVDERIKTREHRRSRLQGLPVERVDRQSRRGVAATGDRLARSGGAAQAVFRGEQLEQAQIRARVEQVNDAAAVGAAPRLVGDQADARMALHGYEVPGLTPKERERCGTRWRGDDGEHSWQKRSSSTKWR